MSNSKGDIFDVFLSHAHVDADVVELIGERLADEEELQVWLDRWILIPGKHWQQEMARGLDQARTCAVCIGQSTPKGWFREEIQRALNRQTKDSSFRVIPLILPNGDRNLVDDFLELRTWVEFKNGLQDHVAFHFLRCGIKGIPPGRISRTPKIRDSSLEEVKKKLSKIKTLQVEQLIDNDVALEYQRRLLDQIIEI